MKHTITLGKGTILAKNADFLQQKKKNADNRIIKEVLLLKDIFSEMTYVWVLSDQILSF